MPKKTLLQELAALSPEEREKLKEFFTASTEPKQPDKPKPKPVPAKASVVYFFKQRNRFDIERIEKDTDSDRIKKFGTALPDRVIATSEKEAARLFWKKSQSFEFLGKSNGRVWKQSRESGKSVEESVALEYEAMMKSPDLTPPPQFEKKFFTGKTIASISQGNLAMGDIQLPR